jgi:hypothetical protein
MAGAIHVAGDEELAGDRCERSCFAGPGRGSAGQYSAAVMRSQLRAIERGSSSRRDLEVGDSHRIGKHVLAAKARFQSRIQPADVLLADVTTHSTTVASDDDGDLAGFLQLSTFVQVAFELNEAACNRHGSRQLCALQLETCELRSQCIERLLIYHGFSAVLGASSQPLQPELGQADPQANLSDLMLQVGHAARSAGPLPASEPIGKHGSDTLAARRG